MKKVITIALLGAIAIGGLLALSHMSKPKVHPLDKPIAEWLRKEAMPKSKMRDDYRRFCVDSLTDPTDKDIVACFKLADDQFPTIPLEIYLTMENK